jgi:hypothetical protein
MALDDIELWIVDHYGPITYDSVVAPLVQVHVACVPLLNGMAIGMGPTRQLAVHDLYHDLTNSTSTVGKPDLPALPLFWHERRWRKSMEAAS